MQDHYYRQHAATKGKVSHLYAGSGRQAQCGASLPRLREPRACVAACQLPACLLHAPQCSKPLPISGLACASAWCLPAGGLSDRLRRITKEVSTLPGQLPLGWESAVLAAMDEDNMGVLRWGHGAAGGWPAAAGPCCVP